MLDISLPHAAARRVLRGSPAAMLPRGPSLPRPPDMRILLTGYSDLAAIVGSVNDS